MNFGLWFQCLRTPGKKINCAAFQSCSTLATDTYPHYLQFPSFEKLGAFTCNKEMGFFLKKKSNFIWVQPLSWTTGKWYNCWLLLICRRSNVHLIKIKNFRSRLYTKCISVLITENNQRKHAVAEWGLHPIRKCLANLPFSLLRFPKLKGTSHKPKVSTRSPCAFGSHVKVVYIYGPYVWGCLWTLDHWSL